MIKLLGIFISAVCSESNTADCTVTRPRFIYLAVAFAGGGSFVVVYQYNVGGFVASNSDIK